MSDPIPGIELTDSHILIVDDDLTSRLLLLQILTQRGYRRLTFAEDGEKGLELARRSEPDLVLLDLVMPGMDGYEFCRQLRATQGMADLPVLVQTGHGDTESRIRAFAAGATDFVTKPLLAEELAARINIHLSNRLLIRRLSAYRERVSQELESARQMQLELNPSPALIRDLSQRYGLDIACHYEASSELGGDYFGFIPIDGERLGIFMGDFAGHGIVAAINTFRIQVLMRQLRRHVESPAAFLTVLNSRLCSLLGAGQFSTLFYGVLNTGDWTLDWAGAAAPKPLLVRAGGEVELLPAAGTPLGITREDFDIDSYRIELPESGALFLYSDALVEARSPDGGFFGRDRLRVLLAEEDISSQRRLTRIRHALKTFCKDQPPADDLTLASLSFDRCGRRSQWTI